MKTQTLIVHKRYPTCALMKIMILKYFDTVKTFFSHLIRYTSVYKGLNEDCSHQSFIKYDPVMASVLFRLADFAKQKSNRNTY